MSFTFCEKKNWRDEKYSGNINWHTWEAKNWLFCTDVYDYCLRTVKEIGKKPTKYEMNPFIEFASQWVCSHNQNVDPHKVDWEGIYQSFVKDWIEWDTNFCEIESAYYEALRTSHHQDKWNLEKAKEIFASARKEFDDGTDEFIEGTRKRFADIDWTYDYAYEVDDWIGILWDDLVSSTSFGSEDFTREHSKDNKLLCQCLDEGNFWLMLDGLRNGYTLEEVTEKYAQHLTQQGSDNLEDRPF